MARKTPEWVGKTDDVKVPEVVQLRLWDKCKGHCTACNRKILAGQKKQLDHEIPLADGGRHAESNLQWLCDACHVAKTGAEATQRASVRRKAKAILGIKRPKGTIKSQGFQKFEKPKAIDKSKIKPLPRRIFYVSSQQQEHHS